MRWIRALAGAALALSLVASPALAQAGGRGQGPGPHGMMHGGPGALERNPAALVLEHRSELELTDEQVERLARIRARVQEENGPRWERVRSALGDGAPSMTPELRQAVRQMTPEQRQEFRDRMREGMRERMRETRPIRDEIRATNRAAGQEIHAILTAEQEETLRPLMRRGPRNGGGEPGMRGPRPRRGAPPSGG